MKIALLSGKGGTGKTFVSTNLTSVIKGSCYLDCDVEEPNGHLFFQPSDLEEEEVLVRIPALKKDACKDCMACVDFCKFNALAHTGKKLLIFDDICHSCGGCIKICPHDALEEKDKSIGRIESGSYKDSLIMTGILNIGEASGGPIIDRMMERAADLDDRELIIDCPPGSACTVMDSIRDADYCVLVLEPTLFGLENFKTVRKLVELYKKAYGVVINKAYDGENPARSYCEKEGIEILMEIGYSREIASLTSDGKIIADLDEDYARDFRKLYDRIRRSYEDEKTIDS